MDDKQLLTATTQQKQQTQENLQNVQEESTMNREKAFMQPGQLLQSVKKVPENVGKLKAELNKLNPDLSDVNVVLSKKNEEDGKEEKDVKKKAAEEKDGIKAEGSNEEEYKIEEITEADVISASNRRAIKAIRILKEIADKGNYTDEEMQERYYYILSSYHISTMNIGELKSIEGYPKNLEIDTTRQYTAIHKSLDEKQPLTEKQRITLELADQWLLENYMTRANGLEDGLLFQLLKRSSRERLLAYYLMEQQCSTTLTDYTIAVSQIQYAPDIRKLNQVKLEPEALRKIYQIACQNTAKIEEVAQYKENLKKDYSTDEIDRLFDQMERVDQTQRAWKEQSSFHIVEKRSKKNDAKAEESKLTNLFEKMLTRYEITAPSEETGGIAKEVVKRGLQGMTLTKLGVSGSASVMQTMVGAQLPAGIELVTRLGGKDKFKETLGNIGIAGNSIGLGIGTLGMIMSVPQMTALAKTLPDKNMAETLGAIADIRVNLLKNESSIVSSSLGIAKVVDAGTYTAAADIAGCVGIGIGVASVGIGTYKMGTAIYQRVKAGNAKKAFYPDNRETLSDEKQEQLRIASNIATIEKRIANRKMVTAGFSMAGGLCAIAGGAMALSVVGLPLAAVGVGLLGLAWAVGGEILDSVQKSQHRKKAIDEYLNLDKLTDDYVAAVAAERHREITAKDKDKIRERIRKRKMEELGFTSDKAFWAYTMRKYAAFIHERLGEIPPEKEGESIQKNEENAAYIKLVEALGLRIHYVTISQGRDKKPLKYVDMTKITVDKIAKKLMG